jgi:hypothetical protein
MAGVIWVGSGVYMYRGHSPFFKGGVNRLLEIHEARKPQMPLPNEALTYTQGLSREVDATYEAYRAGELNGDVRLYSAFRAQARNVIWRVAGPFVPESFFTLGHRSASE